MLENYRVQVFRAVAELLSFRRAAERLHISQPSVSQHVQLLEAELGLRLLDRAAGGIRLTPAGEVLLRFAGQSSRLSQQAMAQLAAIEGASGGELRLAASTTIAQYVLPRILSPFLQRNPRVDLSVKSGNTAEAAAWVAEGAADLGLIEGPSTRRELTVEHFLDDRIELIVPRNHPWAQTAAQPIALAALAASPMLTREEGSGTRRVIEEALTRAGLRPGQISIRMELDSTEAIVSGVEAGLGIGFVSELAIRKELRLRTLAIARVSGLEICRAFSLIRPAGPVASGPAAAFRGFAIEQAGRGSHGTDRR